MADQIIKRNSLISHLDRLMAGTPSTGSLDQEESSLFSGSRSNPTSTIVSKIVPLFAPSGYGKSTLIQQWIDHCTMRSSEQSDDKREPETCYFAISGHTYINFEGAIEGADELNVIINDAVQSTATSLNPHQEDNSSDNGKKKGHWLLVLDNIHNITPDIANVELLNKLASLHSTGFKIALLGRFSPFTSSSTPTDTATTDTPGTPTPRNKKSNKIDNPLLSQIERDTIGIDELAFSRAEQNRLLNIQEDNSLETPTLNTLGFSANEYHSLKHTLTSVAGWPAVIQLIQRYRAIQQPDLIYESIAYYLETVLTTSVSLEELTYLEKIALLPHFNIELSYQLFDDHFQPKIIEQLVLKNFLAADKNSDDNQPENDLPRNDQSIHNESGKWTVKNGLLKNYLTQSSTADSPDLTDSIRHQAIAHFTQRHQLVEAVELTLDLHEYDQALDTIENNFTFFDTPAHWQHLKKWFEMIPKPLIGSRPKLTTFSAWKYICSIEQMSSAPTKTRIPRATSLRDKESPKIPRITTSQETTDKFTNVSASAAPSAAPVSEEERFKQFEAFDSLALVLEHQEDIQQHTRSPLIRRVDAHMNNRKSKKARAASAEQNDLDLAEIPNTLVLSKAISNITAGNLTSAQSLLHVLNQNAIQKQQITLAFNALMLLSTTAHQTGNYSILDECVNRTSKWVEQHGFSDHPLSVWLDGCYFLQAVERNDLEKSKQLLNQLSALYQRSNDQTQNYTIRYYQILFTLSYSKLQECWSSIESAELHINSKNRALIQATLPIELPKLMLLLRQRNLRQAPIILEAAMKQDSSTAAMVTLVASFIQRTLENDTSSNKQRKAILKQYKKGNNSALHIVCHLFEAIIHFRDGKNKHAVTELQSAIQIANQHGYQRTLLNFGIYCHYLLQIAADQADKTENLANDIEPLFQMAKREPSFSNIDPLFASLSKREREILNLVAEGKSNEAIAEQLYRSVGTVKLHVHNTFQKLNVKKRSQATDLFLKYGID